MKLWCNRRFFFRDSWKGLLVVVLAIVLSSLFLVGLWKPDDSREHLFMWCMVATAVPLVWTFLRHLVRPQVLVYEDSLRWHGLGWQRRGRARFSSVSGLSVVVRDDIPILQLNVTDPPLYLEFPIEGEASKLESELLALTGVVNAAQPGQNTWKDGPW
jgi:hypothetical protein